MVATLMGAVAAGKCIARRPRVGRAAPGYAVLCVMGVAANPVALAQHGSLSEPAATAPRARPCPRQTPQGMACVLGGRFLRGSDEGPENERPAAPVFVQTFLMDRKEVTNRQYRACVEARVCRRSVRFRGYMGRAQPAVAMRWQDADAYCRHHGKRLPTEAEWERAASGVRDTRFPWGTERARPCERAVVRTRAGRGCGREATWPVGSRAPGHFGLYDMAGNVWEWVSDHYSWCYQGCRRACGADCAGNNPKGPCGGGDRACPKALGHHVVRGGSWWYRIDRARTSARRGIPGDNPNPHRFGFRCARDLPGGGPPAAQASKSR